MTIKFALGLPHTPWIPEREDSFQRLMRALSPFPLSSESRVFAESEPNSVWSQKLWAWACRTGATHLVQLQDDVIPAPDFWKKLEAMVTAVPDQVIGLEASHPLGPEMFRTGRRWYRTRAWLIGVGYVWPLDPSLPHGLPAFLKWCEGEGERVAKTNEDSLASQFLALHGFDVHHPCPTIIDHDVSVPSTYQNDTHHEFSMYRRPTVTWRDVLTVDALNDPDYWLAPDGAPLLPGPGTQQCWFCNNEQGGFTSPITGARMGKQCLANIFGTILGRV